MFVRDENVPLTVCKTVEWRETPQLGTLRKLDAGCKHTHFLYGEERKDQLWVEDDAL